MGANYHTGVRVVNYPWDSVPATPDYAPDDALYYDYSVGYAIRNPTIWSGGWPNGVTRGWAWYIIRGGLQDWTYHWQGEHHVTIELSDPQPPPYNQMNAYWDDNREAMLWWMRRALTGARGLVTDAGTGAPLDATVDVVQIGKPVRTDPAVGDYHRLLLPGSYTLVCSAAGYLTQTWPVDVVSGTATIQDCALQPDVAYAVAAANSDASGAPGETLTHTLSITNLGTVADSYSLSLDLGAWPATLLEAQIGPLAPGQAGQARVVVDIPAQPARGTLLASDVLTLGVASLAEPAATAQASAVTRAVVDLAPRLIAQPASQSARAGQAVTFTLGISNEGTYTDTFTLVLSAPTWPTTLIPTRTAPLGPGMNSQGWVRVEIPLGAGGVTEALTVTVASGWDPAIRVEQRLVAVRTWGLYLPLVQKSK